MSNAGEVAKWEAYAGRLLDQGKESTNEYQGVARRLRQARAALAGEVEYLRQRKEEGDREWARLLAMVEAGQQPSNIEVADALFQYGLEPASPSATFVARRTVRDIDPPEKRGRRKKPRPDDASLRWLYQLDLLDLQLLQKNEPTQYAAKYGGEPPHQVATARLAKEWNVGVRVIEKLRKE